MDLCLLSLSAVIWVIAMVQDKEKHIAINPSRAHPQAISLLKDRSFGLHTPDGKQRAVCISTGVCLSSNIIYPADAHQPNQHVKQIILLPFEKEFQRFANYCGAVYDLNRISLPTFGRPVQGGEYAQGLVFKTRPSKGNDAASGMCIHCCYLFCLADTMLLPSTSDHSRSKAASSCYA